MSIDDVIDNSVVSSVYLRKQATPPPDERVFYEATIVCKTIDDPFARNGLTKVFLNKNEAIKWLEYRHGMRNWLDFTGSNSTPNMNEMNGMNGNESKVISVNDTVRQIPRTPQNPSPFYDPESISPTVVLVPPMRTIQVNGVVRPVKII